MLLNLLNVPVSSFRHTTLSLLLVGVFISPVCAQEVINIEDMPPQPIQSSVPDDVISFEEEISFDKAPQKVNIESVEIISPRPPELDTVVEQVITPEVTETPAIEMGIEETIIEEEVIETIIEQPEAIAIVAEPMEEVVPEPLAVLEDVTPESVEFVQQQVKKPEVKQAPYSGAYYDSDSIGPSALGASAGPRKVDPRYEPGTSFVVVEKNANSSSRQAQIIAAQRALKLGRYSSALEIYERLYKKAPRNTQILMGLAVAQQHSGFNESSIATYEELLKISPRHTGAMVNLMGLLQQRRPGESYEKLVKLWDRNTQNPAVAAQLGLASASLGNNEDAVRYLGIATSLEPQNALHYYNLAIIFDRVSSHSQAIKYYQKALEVDATHSGGRTIGRDEVYDRLAQLRRL